MPLTFGLMERIAFQHTTMAPGPLLDLLGGLALEVVHAALELDLFEQLAQGPGDTVAIATALDASERGLGALLAALESLGYVRLRSDGWCNTPMTERWLLTSSDPSLRALVPFFRDLVEQSRSLVTTVRQGEHACNIRDWMAARPGGWERYHEGMLAISALLAPAVARAVQLPTSARRLLDLGGSHGLHALRFCERYPELRATVLDLPVARPLAERTIEAAGLGERVGFREGDFLETPLGKGWDVVLLFHVVRALPRPALRRLLERVAEALAPGGQLVIMDQLVERLPSPLLRANARLLELALVNASPGEIYRAEELSGWLQELGLVTGRCVVLKRAGGQAVLTAHNPRGDDPSR